MIFLTVLEEMWQKGFIILSLACSSHIAIFIYKLLIDLISKLLWKLALIQFPVVSYLSAIDNL